jgi:hypothetical protein
VVAEIHGLLWVKITLGENECGEVETPEARIAEVICSRRSMGDTRRQIVDFG